MRMFVAMFFFCMPILAMKKEEKIYLEKTEADELFALVEKLARCQEDNDPSKWSPHHYEKKYTCNRASEQARRLVSMIIERQPVVKDKVPTNQMNQRLFTPTNFAYGAQRIPEIAPRSKMKKSDDNKHK